MLEVRGQGEALAEVLERLVDREAGPEGRDLEEDAARLPEVDRLEVEAVDHALPPRFVLLRRRGPGDVVDGSRARDPPLVGPVVHVEPAALLAAGLETRV